jgi:hypothetical protein
MKEIYAIYLVTIIFLFGCTASKKTPNENADATHEVIHTVIQTESSQIEPISDPLILGGKPYIDPDGKAYRREDAWQINKIMIGLNSDNDSRWNNITGIEQLINLKELQIGSNNNLNAFDLSPMLSLHNLEYLFIWGNITRLPDLSKLEKLTQISTHHTNLESLEGIGAPNVQNININNLAVIDSLAPLNNLRKLETLEIFQELDERIVTLNIADMSNLPSLKKLRLLMEGQKINLQGIEKLTSLEELSIYLEAFNMDGIGRLNNLEFLGLRLTEPEPSLEFLRNMQNLSDLQFSPHPDVQHRKIEPYQVLDLRPLATAKALRKLVCSFFIIRNIAALDALDIDYVDARGGRLFDTTEQSRHWIDFSTSR